MTVQLEIVLGHVCSGQVAAFCVIFMHFEFLFEVCRHPIQRPEERLITLDVTNRMH